MSFWGSLLKRVALIVAEPIAEAVAERIFAPSSSNKPDPNRARPAFNRPHSWQAWEDGASLKRRPVPVCLYCKQEQSNASFNAPCPGPPVRPE